MNLRHYTESEVLLARQAYEVLCRVTEGHGTDCACEICAAWWSLHPLWLLGRESLRRRGGRVVGGVRRPHTTSGARKIPA